MPLKGYVCPPGHVDPPAGSQKPVSYCLGKCPSPCIAPPLLAAMYESEVSNYHQGTYISASMLSGTGCARETVLERSTDFYEQPIRRYWAFRGTHAHSIIEGAQDLVRPAGWLQELKLKVSLTYPTHFRPIFDDENRFSGDYDRTEPLVIQVGGTTDAYNFRTRQLWDMKSMADVKAEMFAQGQKGGTLVSGIEDRWIWQTNIYRWLLANSEIPDELKQEFPELQDHVNYPAPEYLGIQGISMMHLPRSGQLYTIKKRGQSTTHEISEVPVIPLEDVESFVRERALQWYRYLVLEELPPVVDASESWLCKNCVFNGELVPSGVCFPSAERAENSTIEIL